jgi:hypothetical protein
LAMMLQASHKLRSGTIDSKMATHWWRATLISVGPQQAELRAHWKSTDSGLAGPLCHRPRTWGVGGGDKQWFGTFQSDW